MLPAPGSLACAHERTAMSFGRKDPLADLPPDSRREVVEGVQQALGVKKRTAESIVAASEPLWEALEEAGVVDTWGGGEFCVVLPQVCALIAAEADGG